ncbi:ABC transporter permease, partial [Bradyrhizobium sp.]|uniref:ABC transporter permease n=1 Tax=Bradyrhizobium sp. TaxID=376 RepID=UPI003C42672A
MLDRAPSDQKLEAGSETRPVKFRGGGFVPGTSRHAGWIALAAVLAVWQLAGSVGLVNPLFLPTPLATARAIWQLAVSGALWHHLSYSLMRIGTGWILGTIAGIAVGFSIGLFSHARSIGIT